MEINEFLDKHVEGYLFCDLKKMAEIKLDENERYGAAGYPILSSITAGMELLGWLSYDSDEEFSDRNGRGNKYFLYFWNEFMTRNSKYTPQLGILVRKLVRHGLAHSFLAKPGIFVTKGSSDWHLKIGNNELLIDARETVKDFTGIYYKHWKPNLAEDKIRTRIQKKLISLLNSYEDDSKRAFKAYFSSISPESPSRENDFSSLAIHNASPAATIGSPAASVTSFPSMASGLRFSSTISVSASSAHDSKTALEIRKIMRKKNNL